LNRFLETVPLTFTPLTPIHIGCGEDFEPTNYVIEDGALHHFEPARLSLTEAERRLLVQAANRQGVEAIRAVQGFFRQRSSACRKASRIVLPVASGVAEEYGERIGRVAQRESDRDVINRLAIERTAHHPHTGKAYLPGSSLKGAMRTAWLSRMAPPAAPCDPDRGSGTKSHQLEQDILGGRFSSDPFRLLAVSDAAGESATSRIVFAANRRKKPPSGETGRFVREDLSVRCEVVDGGQLRSFVGEIRLLRPGQAAEPGHLPAPEKRIGNFDALAQACNAFYGNRLGSELALCARLCGQNWADRFRELIHTLEAPFRQGQALLLRVGRHSGAESVTLDDWRCIQIRGAKGERRFAREATTIWLAAEDEGGSSGTLPFGWVLAERAEVVVPDALRRWCEAERKGRDNAPRSTADNKRSADSAAPVGSAIVWPRARLRFNAANGTLTAIDLQTRKEAHAHAPHGQELLATLPPDLQQKVRSNAFVQIVAHVRDHTLVSVSPSGSKQG
jgi:CRISPR-associated protein Csm5